MKASWVGGGALFVLLSLLAFLALSRGIAILAFAFAAEGVLVLYLVGHSIYYSDHRVSAILTRCLLRRPIR